MSSVKHWAQAILVVMAIIVVIYGAWLLAIVSAVAMFVFFVKTIIEVSQE